MLGNKDFSNMILSGINIYGSHIQATDFSGSTMVNCQLQHADFSNTNFNRVNFAYANLKGVLVDRDSKLIRSNFDGANLSMARLHQVIMDSCLFTGATDLTRASFDSCSLKNAIFNGVNLKNTSFAYADLSNAVFINVTLDSTVFKHANLQGAYFYGAKENQYSLFGNADLSNASIFNCHFENSSFISAELPNARIENTLFKNANILNANFSGSIIKNCDFSDAIFNTAGGLFLDGSDDIITVESPGSIPAGTDALTIEMAIVPQNQHKIAGLASLNHRSGNLNTLFELYLDAGFHLVFQYKIANENTIHTLISNDTLTGKAYNLIMITYNKGDVNFYIENKPVQVKSAYYTFSDVTYNGTNVFPATNYSPKPGESIETNMANLVLGGFSGICPFANVVSVDSTNTAMAIMYYRYWQSVPEDTEQLYPLQTNEKGETGYPFYYQIEEAPAIYTEGLKNNLFFLNCKEQIIKDTKDINLVLYKGVSKGADDSDPLYHIVNKNFENTLIENTPMFFGW
jgi:uncharacterized protein YjbI with pentapeptide repeats